MTRPHNITDSTMASLREAVEQRFGSRLATDRDYRQLSAHIFSTCTQLLSPSTLKRLWGYLNEPVTPRRHTLSVLAQYAGFSDWDAFINASPTAIESGPVGHTILDVSSQLSPGDRLLLTWHPGRRAEIKYLGLNRFIITAARATRLEAGTIFECPAIISGEPLYINIVEGARMGAYVCGKQQGVKIERVFNNKH